MLRLLKLTLFVTTISFTVGCNKDKQEYSQIPDGSIWTLKACISTNNGDVQFVSNANHIEMSFPKKGVYTFSSGLKRINSNYRLKAEVGNAMFSKPTKPATFDKEVTGYLSTILKSNSYELVGNNLKIASSSTNKFLIFERIR